MKLLTTQNAKTTKGESIGAGYLTGILYLAPHNLSGHNVCPWSTPGCRKSCLYSAGRGRFKSIQDARIKKTKWLFEDKQSFIAQLLNDIAALERKAKRQGLVPVVRLNGCSDLLWERVAPQVFAEFPHITFYDYSKAPLAVRKNRPSNYYLTQSYSELFDLSNWLPDNNNLAVVFKDKLPELFAGKRVIDGTSHDLRFLDPKGVVVGLLAKGDAKADKTGFVL